MMDDKLFPTTSELARRAQVDDSKVSRSLAILRVDSSVLDEVRSAPTRFTDRHLYALSQIHHAVGTDRARDAAHAVATATTDKPVSARKLEALFISFSESGSAPSRGRRKNSVPMAIRSSTGEVMGAMKSYRDGRLEFKPTQPLPEAVAERIAEAVKAIVCAELQAHLTQGAGKGG
jgi:hypothetical protein